MSKNNAFIERSIMGALSFFKESLFAEEFALKKGLLQGFDPRVKALTFFAFIISAVFLKSIILISLLYAFCLLLAAFSRINILFFLKRTWIFIPLFSLFIALPALFSFVSPGEPVFTLKLFGMQAVITRQGIGGAALFVMRVVTCVSFVVLLSLVTRHTVLLRALRIFKVPHIFVMILGMGYRYIFLFAQTIEHTYLAIKSRVGGVRVTSGQGQRMVAWKIASLWERANALNEEVYLAMLSRGFTGEPVAWDEMRFRARDGVWLACSATIICLMLYLS